MDPFSVVGIVPPRVVRGPGGPFSVVGMEALAATRLFSKSKLFRVCMERDP